MNPPTPTRCAWLFWTVVALALGSAAVAPAQDAGPKADRQQDADSTALRDDDPQGDPPAGEQAEPELTLNLTTARATITAFLQAIDDAEHGQVARYTDALACLDLSGLAELPEDVRRERSRAIASVLNEFITRHGVKLELIPDDADGGAFVFPASDAAPAVVLAPANDGLWRFTWDSIEALQKTAPGPAANATRPHANQESPSVKSAETPPNGAAEAPVSVAYRSAQATMRTFRDAMQEEDYAAAAQCMDLSEMPPVSRAERGSILAVYLYQSIRMATKEEILLQTFSDDPNAGPEIIYEKLGGEIVLARQGEGSPRKGEWLFTRETVAGLETLRDKLKQAGASTPLDAGKRISVPLPIRLRDALPPSLKVRWLVMEHYQWLGLLILAVLGRVAQWVTTELLQLVGRHWLRRRGVTVNETIQATTYRPVGILALAGVWYWGVELLALPSDVLTVVMYAVKFVACWALVWTCYRAVDLLADFFSSLADKTETTLDDLLVPFARKAAKTLVTVLGVVFIYQQFTDETPLKLLAGLGLGGLALALAAQEPLKNLFGSLTVILDRPFAVGDWVVVGDVEGTVESVGFRSTRIRTFYNSQIVLPNANLMNATVDNYGRRRYRRIRVMLSLTYSTPPAKIDAFCEGIRELIRLHPYTRKDYYHVYFNQFSGSSLDILLYCFLETPDWSTELRERHHLFNDILRLADRLGVEFAFPTQTVWLERARRDAAAQPTGEVIHTDGDPDRIGLDEAAKVYSEVYGESASGRGPVVIDQTPRSKRSSENRPPDSG